MPVFAPRPAAEKLQIGVWLARSAVEGWQFIASPPSNSNVFISMKFRAVIITKAIQRKFYKA